MTAYATGLVPFHDGMLVEDFLDAIDMREAGGVVPRDRWVDEFRELAAAQSLMDVL